MKKMKGNENDITKKCHVEMYKDWIRKSPFTATSVIIDSFTCKNHRWMLLLQVKGCWVGAYCLNVLPMITYSLQGERGIFMMGRSAGYHINQMIQFSITSEVRQWHICLVIDGMHTVIHVLFLPKMFNLNLIIRTQ